MSKQVYPCLWFESQAAAAAEFYCSVFPNSKITSKSPMVVNFELDGKKFMALNDKRGNEFNEGISFVIPCENQKEIDYFWDKLTSDGGAENRCGWCKDKFGISWQVIPEVLGKLMSDPSRAQRVVQAFMKMNKLDIETLMNA